MKKVLFVLLALSFAATSALAAAPNELAAGGGANTAQYHSYDGLVCGDCHTLHNSEDGADVAVDGGPNKELLKRGNWTDMCLSCHMQGQNTSGTAALPDVLDSGWEAPIVMTLDGVDPAGIAMPGGDFYYSNLNDKLGHNPAYSAGEVGGAPTSVMMAADSVLGDTPPGGVIDGDDEWSCHSCHGMHSRFSPSYTAWRQVQRKVNGVVTTGDVSGFGVETAAGNKTQDASYEPIKSNSRGDIQGTSYVNERQDTNPLEGADLYADESDTNKNVYRGGFSSFCSACHGAFHGGAGEAENVANANTNPDGDGRWMRHPTNVVMADQTTSGLSSRKYGTGSYTAQITNAQASTPNPDGYDWRYPLVQADGDFNVTVAGTGTTITDATLDTSRLSCLTCHKAHATQYENMTRWDATGHAFIADGVEDFNGVASDGDNPAYGCGKCHQKGGKNAFVKAF
jgi:hypothetical protein